VQIEVLRREVANEGERRKTKKGPENERNEAGICFPSFSSDKFII
jgi:hypothetical protein